MKSQVMSVQYVSVCTKMISIPILVSQHVNGCSAQQRTVACGGTQIV